MSQHDKTVKAQAGEVHGRKDGDAVSSGRPALGELLARRQRWSRADLFAYGITSTQARGDCAGAQLLRQQLGDTPAVDALSALAANHQLVQHLSGWQWHAVRDAREHGASWQQIADVLGGSPEQARAGYRDRIEQAERHAPQFTDTARYRNVLDDKRDDQAGQR